jgi:hypothetical protein
MAAKKQQNTAPITGAAAPSPQPKPIQAQGQVAVHPAAGRAPGGGFQLRRQRRVRIAEPGHQGMGLVQGGDRLGQADQQAFDQQGPPTGVAPGLGQGLQPGGQGQALLAHGAGLDPGDHFVQGGAGLGVADVAQGGHAVRQARQ